MRSEILQYLVDKLREKTETDYINAETRLDALPRDVVQDVMADAAENFALGSGASGTVADLADVIDASVRIGMDD